MCVHDAVLSVFVFVCVCVCVCAWTVPGNPRIPTLLFKYTSFVHPGTILRMDFGAAAVDAYVFHHTVVPGLDPEEFEAFQDFAVSKCVCVCARVCVFACVYFCVCVPVCAHLCLHGRVRVCVLPWDRDGTRVPLFYVRARGGAPGPRPCLLYGYGGFNISLGPYFSSTRLVLLKELGGVFALAM